MAEQDKKIRKEMTFSEVLQKYPSAARIMLKHGLHCIGCCASSFETIEGGCMSHGIKEKDMKKMLEEMNEAAED